MAGVIKAESEESSCVPVQQIANEANDANPEAIPSTSRAGSSEDNEASASPNSSNASDEEANGNEYPPIFQEVGLLKFTIPFY